jgi:hypothetical protein
MATIAEQFRECPQCVASQLGRVAVTGGLRLTPDNAAAVVQALSCGLGVAEDPWIVPLIDVVDDVAIVGGGSGSPAHTSEGIAMVCVAFLKMHGIAARAGLSAATVPTERTQPQAC